MGYILLLLLAVTLSGFSLSSLEFIKERINKINLSESSIASIYPSTSDVEKMLRQSGTLSEPVINKVLTSLTCAAFYKLNRNNVLTIIDYSLPSNQKRLWVFDLQNKKLLFYTYVSHGIKSGALLTNYFSNKYNSKASSIGVYRTEKAYYGREGLSLRLEGLDRSFNDNASNRSVVMHGGWYVNEQFIKRYGRPGRSWGCPALPLELYQSIINTIKDSSLFVVYYPSEDWFTKSKFLNCNKVKINNSIKTSRAVNPIVATEPPREDVLFAHLGKSNRDEQTPILVMAANNYEAIFHTTAPLERMLRRQINKMEYVALSNQEFNQLVVQNNKAALNEIFFVVPVIFMVRGYYETQMKIVNLGKIKDVRLNSNNGQLAKSYTVSFEARPTVNLSTANYFIRWLGL